eukprot:TRINITY_DN6394_c0_g2_i1.p2 TRINITY_DN6394_c0_g2~~TRINITY_DN6394_c0_g2_i1.p2  ORF type:complete len:118 (-),score=32.87 TRINITY_DN6394_c0_g2_i1:741-1094(-)
MIDRYKHIAMPEEFYTDWAEVACDEARHFTNLCARLEKLNSPYGSLLAHDMLWKNAQATNNDLMGRIAIMNLVQESRALDAHERLVEKVNSTDKESAKLIDVICEEEVEHVRKGVKW